MNREREVSPEEVIRAIDDWDEKILMMSHFTGGTLEEAEADLVDMGVIAPRKCPSEEEQWISAQ